MCCSRTKTSFPEGEWWVVDSPEQALREAHAAEVEGNLAIAESILRDACKRWKREPEFKMRHGRVLRRMGHEKKALKVFRTVLKAHPQRADAATAAAECAMAIGKSKLSETLWGRALALGASSDEATAGLCRAMWAGRAKEEAWERALTAFTQQGRTGRALHAFLQECAPILGTSVPELDLLEIGELDHVDTGVTGVRSDAGLMPATFASDSVEAMAGLTADALTAPVDTSDADRLLGKTLDDHASVDMSALAQPRPTISARPEVDLPDDLLDFE